MYKLIFLLLPMVGFAQVGINTLTPTETFDVDENVCHRVIIEAIDAKHAQSLINDTL